jgi:hypothetical protein
MIELTVLFAMVLVVGGTVVKLYEWRQDVLYGRYTAPQLDAERKRPLNYDAGDQRWLFASCLYRASASASVADHHVLWETVSSMVRPAGQAQRIGRPYKAGAADYPFPDRGRAASDKTTSSPLPQACILHHRRARRRDAQGEVCQGAATAGQRRCTAPPQS